ncbi:minor capsid protein [Staphylococcus delphini]|uniref:minor capsid protein n=2 Tax=Staphylococcus intermedius group TaxID=2815305 RepID=UPI000BBCC78A|nr:minor capsid protein [Staphylococcus delphini]PCF48457.1 head protein [Staphylococcus delphini]PCF73148.1 head protein [Staphylococcus delphini]
MSNLNDYWLERAKMFIQSETLEDAAKIAEIERIVAMMIADIYKNLLAYYGKLATAEGIDWREAKKIVDAFDVEAFQMQAKTYVENKDFSEKANEELKRYNTTMYVNREKLLKHELGLIVTKAYAEQEKVVNHHLQDSVTRTLKHQAGILGADVHVKQSDVEAIVYSNFGKLNWSERLWNNQDELRKDVERMASHVMLRGRHPYEFVPEIRKKQQQTVANTKRLLITEAARVQTEAQKLHYLETMGDDAEYEFVAKRDEKTSKICRHYDKKVFKVKDMVPGVNAPPMHPHCRSTTVPHVSNWRDKFFKDRQGKYRLKDEDTQAIDTINSNSNEQEPFGLNKRNKNDEFKVDVKYIQSNEYRRKFDKISDNKVLNRNIYQAAKEMLEHRDGDDREDLYGFDEKTGKMLFKSIENKNNKSKVYYTKNIEKIVEKNPYQIISVHNHPRSTLPSVGDLTAQHLRKYAKGIIVGHNGRLIVYSVNKDIDFGSFRHSLDILGVNFKSKYNTSEVEQNKMLSKLKEIGLIDYKVL